MITREAVEQVLKQAGLQDQCVCIHASMRSFGDRVEGGAQGLLQAFLMQRCTVMTPAFSYHYLMNPASNRQMPPQNGAGDYAWYRENKLSPGIFHVSSKEISEEDMGVFARIVLCRRDAVRGNHPLNSFAAAGEKAGELIASQTWQDVYAPFEKLCSADGFVLMMGTDLSSATILHYAEQLSGRTPFVRWAKDEKGQVRCASVGSCSNGFEKLAPALAHLETRFSVGNSLWRLYPAHLMAQAAADAIRKNSMITHCENPACRRCRDAVQGGPVLTADFWQNP